MRSKDLANNRRRQMNNMDLTKNGTIRQCKDIKLRSCPWGELLSLWALLGVLGVSVPYMAAFFPPVARTDINWWMSGVVYHPPQPREGQVDYFSEISSKVENLRSLGINSVRLSDFFKRAADGAVMDFYEPNEAYGNTQDFVELVEVLDRYSMRIIIDIPVGQTSTSHEWFQQDRRDGSLYTWSSTHVNHDDSDDDIDPRNTWEKEGNYFYKIKMNTSWALLNFANEKTRLKIQDVIHYWLDKGVDGMILLDYDSVSFKNRTTGDRFNHIDMSDPVEKKLYNLAGLTTFFRKYLDAFMQDKGGEIFFGVDVATKDVKSWHTLCESGADMVMNHELELISGNKALTDQFNSVDLRNKVKKSLSRVPRNTFKNWRICNENTPQMRSDQQNTLNLLNMVHLLLPGAAFLCPGQLPVHDESLAVQHFKQLVRWRKEPSMSWGDTETTYYNEDIFSFARFAYGKKLPRYLVITNFGENPQKQNFTLIRKGLKVPDLGILRHFTCDDAMNERTLNEMNDVVYLNETLVYGRCALLVELKL